MPILRAILELLLLKTLKDIIGDLNLKIKIQKYFLENIKTLNKD